MKVWKSLLGLAAASFVVTSASAQIISPEAPGPRAPKATAATPEAISPRAGTFKFVITLVRKSNSMVGASQQPICMASVYHWPANYHSVQGGAASNNGTCTIMLPYYWPKADTAYTISPRVWIMMNKDNFPLPTPVIYSVQDLGAQALPANGAVTTFNATIHY
jgi:hypothetical protein